MSLYNLRTVDGGHVINKFDHDLNVESSYFIGTVGCECPGWQGRGRCRHEGLVPYFTSMDRVDTNWFLETDNLGHFVGWRQYVGPFDAEGATYTAETTPPTVETFIEFPPETYGEDLSKEFAKFIGEAQRAQELEAHLLANPHLDPCAPAEPNAHCPDDATQREWPEMEATSFRRRV